MRKHDFSRFCIRRFNLTSLEKIVNAPPTAELEPLEDGQVISCQMSFPVRCYLHPDVSFSNGYVISRQMSFPAKCSFLPDDAAGNSFQMLLGDGWGVGEEEEHS